VKSLLLADNAGADRTEFCADRTSGGVTPPFCEILYSLPLLQNQVHVMIRPRGGDFIYSDAEFEQMKHEIHTIKSAPGKLAGFVFGILDANGKVDVLRNSELVALAKPLSCTFHPAFDETKDLYKGLEDVIACRFKTILTSGGAADPVAGAAILGRLVEKAKGRVTIMPGGGMRSSNIGFIKEKTKANRYRSSAVVGDKISLAEVHLLRRSLLAKQ
jgi:copper homeostasis protein